MIKTFFLISVLFIVNYSFLIAEGHTWQEMMDSCNTYQQAQDFQSALKWALQAEVKAKAEFGEVDTNVADIQICISEIFWSMRNFNEALNYARLDSNIRILKQGKESLKYISTSIILGNQYFGLSQFSEAEKSYTEALKISRTIYKDNHSVIVNSILVLAEFYKNIQEFNKAEPFYLESIEMNKRIYQSDHEELAKSLNNAAFYYYLINNISKAELYYNEALDMMRHLYKEGHPNLAMSINNLGQFYQNIGNYSKAEQLFLEALEMKRRIYNIDNKELALGINNLANYYYAIGDYIKAEPLFVECHEMTQRIFKSDHPNLVLSYRNLGTFYLSKGSFTEAEPLLIEALHMSRRLYKTDHQYLVQILNNLGIFYQRKGNFSKAELFTIEALEMRRRLYKTDNPDLASGINNLAFLYYVMRNYLKAEELYNEGLDMYRRLYKSDNINLSLILNNLGLFYTEIGNYSKAESLLQESLEMQRRLLKTDHPNIANCLNNLAKLYDAIGDFSKADTLFREALNMNRRIFKTDHPDLATSIMNLGYFYSKNEKFYETETLFNESLDMKRRIYKSDHPDLAMSINNLSSFYNEMGDIEKAESLMIEANEMYNRIYKSDNQDLAISKMNLAVLYFSKGDYIKAEQNFVEAIDMFRRVFKGDHHSLANSLNNIAAFYYYKGNFFKAEPYFIESLEMTKRIFKTDHPSIVYCLSWIGNFYFQTNNYLKAEQQYIEALDMNRRIYKPDHPKIATSLNNLAKLYHSMHNFSKAEELYKNSLNIEQSTFLKNSTFLSEKEKEKYWKSINDSFEGFYTFAVDSNNKNSTILGFTFDKLIFTKGVLFNSSNKIKKRILESADSVSIANYKLLKQYKELLSKLYSLSDKEIKKVKFNIDSLENIANNLEKEISLKSEDFKQSYEKKKVSWRSIQTILKPDECAIEMVRFRLMDKKRWTDTVYYAALIVSDQTTENPDIVILENGKELEEMYYNQYRNFVKMKATDNESFKQFWQKIYEKTKDYKKIYFSPDGIYNKLNISTLQVESGKYLLDFQEIHQLNSTQDILLGYYSKQKETNVYNSAVLIGNPDFSLSQDKVKEKERTLLSQNDLTERSTNPMRAFNLSSLPGTEKEVKNISKYLKGKNWVVNEYTKEDAVKAVIKTANSPRVLHIATHGLFLSDIKPDDREIFGMETKRMIGNPLLRSGLFFAGASSTIDENFRPSGYDNGFLTAYEAMNLDLDKTELVVLSACETGLGEIKNGEGVYGLQRAFIQAGAKSIIMSLWSVSDEATQELMSTFYKEWLGGKTKREAFHYAQMKLKEKYPAPYYWGAFVMVGE